MSPGTTTDPTSLNLTVFPLLVTNYKPFPVVILARRNTINFAKVFVCFSLLFLDLP